MFTLVDDSTVEPLQSILPYVPDSPSGKYVVSRILDYEPRSVYFPIDTRLRLAVLSPVYDLVWSSGWLQPAWGPRSDRSNIQYLVQYSTEGAERRLSGDFWNLHIPYDQPPDAVHTWDTPTPPTHLLIPIDAVCIPKTP